MPPDDFFPKLRKFLDERNILLFADEVLTSMAEPARFSAANTGTSCRMSSPWQRLRKRLPRDLHGGAHSVCGRRRQDQRLDQLRRQSDGVRRSSRLLRGHRRRRTAGTCAGAGGSLQEAHGGRTTKYKIVGDTRCKGCLLGIELVKDKALKTPFDEAGKMVYQKAFGKGLAWVPAGHILRMSPPIIMPNEVALKGMDIIEEAIAETEKELLG